MDWGKLYDRIAAGAAVIFTATGAYFAAALYYATQASTVGSGHGSEPSPMTPWWALALVAVGLTLGVVSIVRLFVSRTVAPASAAAVKTPSTVRVISEFDQSLLRELGAEEERLSQLCSQGSSPHKDGYRISVPESERNRIGDLVRKADAECDRRGLLASRDTIAKFLDFLRRDAERIGVCHRFQFMTETIGDESKRIPTSTE